MSCLSVDAITRVSVLTPKGRSAVAVVAVAGPQALAAVERYFSAVNGKPLEAQSVGRIVYGHWGGATGEDLIVCRRTLDELEIHCHGGSQSAPKITADLIGAGCVEVDWQTWLSRRASCPLAAQAQSALADATTLRTAAILLDQYHGALRHALSLILADLQCNRLGQAADRLQQLLQHSAVGLHLTRPWSVVIAGRPNVGKSSLINALVGYQRTLVFDQPGTTRDVVSAATAVDGWPIALSDTAGLRPATETVESTGIALAKDQLRSADLVVWVLDATELDRQPLGALADAQAKAVGLELDVSQTFIVVNKVDLIESPVQSDLEAIATSAISGKGIECVLQSIASRLVPQAPAAGAAVPFTQKQVDALQAALNASRQANVEAALDALSQI
ncbi:MAG: 50S ribosome-binding GTPase [Pirellulales bacterium]|nr:50S ribosome-binding GTPase [Pirellulales bacterium]